MERTNAVAALAALAHEGRLAIFRLLVKAGPDGLVVGQIAKKLEMPGATLSFHLSQLKHAGLVIARRDGRRLIQSADFDCMNGLIAYLTENCCGGSQACTPVCKPASRTSKRKTAA
jgi:DNA-binding transcriptional ArsR family regulator